MSAEPQPARAPATLAVSLGRPHVPGAAVSPPIEVTSVYRPDAAGSPLYGRERNATWEALEEVLGGLEGGRAVAFSAGVAAINAVLARVPVGGTVVAPDDAYTGTRANLDALSDRGLLTARMVDITDAAAVATACDGADLLWIESPTNPLLRVADIAALAAAARRRGVLVAVDNTFATPLGQRPLAAGADVVVHSVTKFLSGHADVILGAAVTSDNALADAFVTHRTLTGSIPGPVEAWLALRGIRSLPARFARAQTSAGLLAERLAAHPGVERVRYPGLASHPHHDLATRVLDGFGAMISFDVAGGAAGADALCGAVSLAVHTTSLGGVETTLERRAAQPLDAYLPEGLVRLSVGCEDVEDLWTDLSQALAAAMSAGRSRR